MNSLLKLLAFFITTNCFSQTYHFDTYYEFQNTYGIDFYFINSKDNSYSITGRIATNNAKNEKKCYLNNLNKSEIIVLLYEISKDDSSNSIPKIISNSLVEKRESKAHLTNDDIYTYEYNETFLENEQTAKTVTRKLNSKPNKKVVVECTFDKSMEEYYFFTHNYSVDAPSYNIDKLEYFQNRLPKKIKITFENKHVYTNELIKIRKINFDIDLKY